MTDRPRRARKTAVRTATARPVAKRSRATEARKYQPGPTTKRPATVVKEKRADAAKPRKPKPAPRKRVDHEIKEPRLLHSIRVRNLLSFGPDTPALKLQNLNVFVGLNGAGKSNLIDAIQLLQALPNDLNEPILHGGGIEQWLHNPTKLAPAWERRRQETVASIQVAFGAHLGADYVIPRSKYQLEFGKGRRHHADIRREQLQYISGTGCRIPSQCGFTYLGGNKYEVTDPKSERRAKREIVSRDKPHHGQSFFHQAQSEGAFPMIAHTAECLNAIRFYREWVADRTAMPCSLPVNGTADDSANGTFGDLPTVVSKLNQNAELKDAVLDKLYQGVDFTGDICLAMQQDRASVNFREGQRLVPAHRVSDGTLRLLFLLSVLLDPNPPPLICIEHPELGIHMDVIPSLVDLMEDAAQRTQLIVTTHSEMLIDCLTHRPEALIACEQVFGETEMVRVDMDEVLRHAGRRNADKSLSWFWYKGFLGGTC